MNIVHYSLGFPPYRSGGLTKFCMDLMHQQVIEGNKVSLLWPGRMLLFGGKAKVKFCGIIEGISSFEVINPTPVPYDEGIHQIALFMNNGDINEYEKFLDNIEPEVIHIHTLMGLHKNFLEAAKRKSIRIVFSAHDFFPICPKVTMFREGRVCDCIDNCISCDYCNSTALSMWKIRILQSGLYRRMKDNIFIRKIRKSHRDLYLSEEMLKTKAKDSFKNISKAKEYMELRSYYNEMLSYMDIIHFNSNVTKNIYQKYMGWKNSILISITHSDIKDRRRKKVFDSNLRITYLGPQSGSKGYFFLTKALDKMWTHRKNFSLDVYFEPMENKPYIKAHDKYSYEQMNDIFQKTDVLIAPSICYETFGYTVLEALSYGVPVIITKNVGAADILPKDGGIVIEANDINQLVDALNGLTPERLTYMNKNIINNACILTVEKMSQLIEHNCYNHI